MLAVGDTMPAFRLKDQTGQMFDSTSIQGKAAVLFFYPKDYTPGCTAEACSFRDRYTEIQALGAEVIGISTDSVQRHQKFSTSYALPYRLLSDPQRKVAKQFVVGAHLFGLLSQRVTFVIHPTGKIILAHADLRPASHIRKAIEVLQD
ncbi:MAG: peroxiredoxin [Flavobacteriaceae bacterium]